MAKKADEITGVRKGPYAAVGSALEIIPRTLAQNCGANPIRTLTALRVNPAVISCLLRSVTTELRCSRQSTLIPGMELGELMERTGNSLTWSSMAFGNPWL